MNSPPRNGADEGLAMDIFTEWVDGATRFAWSSTTAANTGRTVEVFARRCGTPGAPALVCVHGFPTSSIDYHGLTRELGSEFDIFTLDFPGYGCRTSRRRRTSIRSTTTRDCSSTRT